MGVGTVPNYAMMCAMRRALVALLLLWSGWAAAQTNLAPGFTKLPPESRIALMPADVELFEMGMGGINEPKADWTEAATRNIMADLRARKAKLGARAVEVPRDNDPVVEDLNAVHGAVSRSIMVHHFGPLKLPTKNGQLDWTLGPEAAQIGAKYNADYALFVWVRDSYASAERKAAMVIGALFGVGMTAGIQQAYASLVDLKTGRIVWFNRLVRGTGDLREAEPATETLDAILAGFPL